MITQIYSSSSPNPVQTATDALYEGFGGQVFITKGYVYPDDVNRVIMHTGGIFVTGVPLGDNKHLLRFPAGNEISGEYGVKVNGEVRRVSFHSSNNLVAALYSVVGPTKFKALTGEYPNYVAEFTAGFRVDQIECYTSDFLSGHLEDGVGMENWLWHGGGTSWITSELGVGFAGYDVNDFTDVEVETRVATPKVDLLKMNTPSPFIRCIPFGCVARPPESSRTTTYENCPSVTVTNTAKLTDDGGFSVTYESVTTGGGGVSCRGAITTRAPQLQVESLVREATANQISHYKTTGEIIRAFDGGINGFGLLSRRGYQTFDTPVEPEDDQAFIDWVFEAYLPETAAITKWDFILTELEFENPNGRIYANIDFVGTKLGAWKYITLDFEGAPLKTDPVTGEAAYYLDLDSLRPPEASDLMPAWQEGFRQDVKDGTGDYFHYQGSQAYNGAFTFSVVWPTQFADLNAQLPTSRYTNLIKGSA